MNPKIALLLAVLLPAVASATTFSMRVPAKGLTTSAATTTPSSPGGTTTPPVPVKPDPAIPTLNAQQEISYGGLTLARVGNTRMNYAAAVAACAGAVNGKTGWRIVTQAEFTPIINATGAQMFADAGYDMSAIGWIWNEFHRGGQHLVSRPVDNRGSIADDVDPWYTVCVRNN